MAEAVALAKLHLPARSTRPLGTAAIAGRFAKNNVLRILAHQDGRTISKPRARASGTTACSPGEGADQVPAASMGCAAVCWWAGPAT